MRYWIQPVSLRVDSSPRRFGLDQHFVFPNVGKSEFEFGAIPQATRVMRESWQRYTLSTVKYKGHSAFIWALKPDVSEARAFFRKEMQSGASGVVSLGLRSTYGITPFSGKEEELERAWLNIDGNPWVVCASHHVARLWGSCIEDSIKPLFALAERDFPLRLFYLEEDVKKAISNLRPLDADTNYVLLKALTTDDVHATHLAVNGRVFCTFTRSALLTSETVISLVQHFKAQGNRPTLWVEVPMERRFVFSANL